MLFNSIDFAVFLPVMFFIFWFGARKSTRIQNIWIVIGSYVFYGWWDWRFLSLILFSTLVDFTVGRLMEKESRINRRKLLLWISILVNLGLLGFFKYYNFFVDNFTTAFTFFGGEISPQSLNVILPVGISFYTFQTLSYTIDVYRGQIKPTSNFIAFAAYVSFFPQLVAGPIERATNLLPQFFKPKTFDREMAVAGMRQILWGLFKKVVIADNCAVVANEIFNNSAEYSGATLFVGAVFFAFQIYGDFSGYSDIAIGTAKLFGFKLMQNFAFPYFSRDIAEFWRRWHISLSTWFRDYLYIPLGGSRGTKATVVRNVFIIFIVSGFWHGASWTFIVWGALNALYFLPLLLGGKNRANIEVIGNDGSYSVREFAGMFSTFFLTVLAWVFFRSTGMPHAITYLTDMFTGLVEPHNFGMAYYVLTSNISWAVLFLLIVFIAVEWHGRRHQFALEKMARFKSPVTRRAAYVVLALLCFLFGHKQADFIYFQF